MMSQLENVLDPRREQYMEWLCTAPSERHPDSKTKYAVEAGVAQTTLRRWEKDPIFLRQWQARADEIVGSPERSQRVLDVLFQLATGGDVKAAQLYLTATNKMAPPTVTVKTESAAQLSDDELNALIGLTAGAEVASRVGLAAA